MIEENTRNENIDDLLGFLLVALDWQMQTSVQNVPTKKAKNLRRINSASMGLAGQ